eukprot:1201495-Rhodomonas_salina.2
MSTSPPQEESNEKRCEHQTRSETCGCVTSKDVRIAPRNTTIASINISIAAIKGSTPRSKLRPRAARLSTLVASGSRSKLSYCTSCKSPNLNLNITFFCNSVRSRFDFSQSCTVWRKRSAQRSLSVLQLDARTSSTVLALNCTTVSEFSSGVSKSQTWLASKEELLDEGSVEARDVRERVERGLEERHRLRLERICDKKAW